MYEVATSILLLLDFTTYNRNEKSRTHILHSLDKPRLGIGTLDEESRLLGCRGIEDQILHWRGMGMIGRR